LKKAEKNMIRIKKIEGPKVYKDQDMHNCCVITIEYIDPDRKTSKVSKVCLLEMASKHSDGEMVDL
jgi:hypothetical protein